MASGQARVALRSLSATPLGYGVLPVRTSMYIPKRKGEAQLSVQHGAPRERCCDPPALPFLCFWVSALLCTALVLLRYGPVIRFPFYIFCCWPQGTCAFIRMAGIISGSVGGACINNFTFFGTRVMNGV